jgi:hypothetical protein
MGGVFEGWLRLSLPKRASLSNNVALLSQRRALSSYMINKRHGFDEDKGASH